MTEPLTSTSSEVRRIDATGTVWFSVTLLAGAAFLGPLLASGWRPSDLPALAEFAWWVGAVAGLGSLALLCWAGCPVLRGGLDAVDRQKAMSIRVGVVLVIASAVLQSVAIVVSPVA